MARRTENAAELVPIIDKVFASKPRDHWMKVLKEGGDFIYTVVNSIADLPSDPQMIENDYVVDYDHPTWGRTQIVGVPFRLSKTPGNPKAPAPEFGQHTETILTELLGYSWEDVAKLRDSEVI